MIFALCACGGTSSGGTVSYDIPEGKALPDDAVLDVTIASHASWPYNENWKVWEYIKEAVGGTINVNAIPATDFGTKFSLVMAAPDSLPDVFGFQGKPGSFSDYCEQGAFLALDDYEEFLPDYNEKWSYGAAESEVMYDIVAFLKKMVDEKLMPQDFFSISASSWQELVSTDRGFIMPEYQIRIDFFNNIARANNPEYTIAAMKPPVAENGLGVAMVNKFNNDPTGMAVPNTGDEASIANAMRYVNWFYSDAGSEVVSWGKEGETYEVVDGKKRFIFPENENNAQILYGFQTIGSYLRIDPAAAEACMSEEQAATTDFALEHTYPELDPTSYMSLSSAEATEISDYTTSLRTFVQENIQKFVLGQRPMSEWDKFQEELSALPIAELLSVYEEAYNRIK